jgi:two-component system cell cycle sensor histidine kinase/response regulator CckA
MGWNMTRLLCLLWSCIVLTAASGKSMTTGELRVDKAEEKRVLILCTYNYNQPAQQQISAGLETARKVANLNPDDFIYEYLDISPPKTREQRLLLSRLLLDKYAGQRFDLIITVFNDALNFLLNEARNLSPGSPCLALYGQKRPHLERTGKPIFQSPLAFDVRGTLELALKLFPETRRVLFVSGKGDLDKAFEYRAMIDFGSWQKKLDFEYSSNMSVNNLLEHVRSLPPGTVVIYSRISSDITGNTYQPIDIAISLAQTSNAPVFCLATSQLGTGVIGGSMVDVQALSTMLGRILPSLMTDNPLPLEPASRFLKPMVDWQQIKRWGVNPGLIPDNALIINRPPTLWNQYKAVVVGTIAAFLVLAGLITALIIQNYRRRIAERQARESESRYRILIERAPDAILVYDVDQQKFVDANASAERLFGCSRDELLESDPQRFYVKKQPDGRNPDESISDHSLRVLAGEDLQFDRIIHSANGRDLYCEVRVVRLPSENRKLIRASFIDVTERRQVEEALRENQKQLMEAQRLAHIGHWELDHTSNKITWSDEIFRIFEIDKQRSSLSYEVFMENIHPDDREMVITAFKQSMQTNKPYKLVHRLLFPDGRIKYVHEQGETYYSPDGEPIRSGGTVQDITELKHAEIEKMKLQEQLTTAQKMEAVGRLAGGVAHDFNNILSVIMGHTDLALQKTDDSMPVFANLKEIQNAAIRSADLTRQLLAFARKQTAIPKIMNLNDSVEGMLKMLRRMIGEDIELIWKPEMGLWPVMIDPSQVDQLLANLCINARDAIAGVGKITIETRNILADEALCSRYADCMPGEYVMLAVSDNGSGMDKDTLDHIFEPFFTTKGAGQGTGLGLATVYGIVKQNEGFINVRSEQGKGSTFYIYLHRCKVENIEQITDRPEKPYAGHGETILIVEDDTAALHTGKTMLEHLGYTVLTASTPKEALLMAENHIDRISLLITDVIMPKMNGWELAKIITGMKPGLKCLFCSGYTADVISNRGMLEEGVNFLQKPYSIKDLAIKVRQAME